MQNPVNIQTTFRSSRVQLFLPTTFLEIAVFKAHKIRICEGRDVSARKSFVSQIAHSTLPWTRHSANKHDPTSIHPLKTQTFRDTTQQATRHTEFHRLEARTERSRSVCFRFVRRNS